MQQISKGDELWGERGDNITLNIYECKKEIRERGGG